MAIRRYLRWLRDWWGLIPVVLFFGALIMGCTISAIATDSYVTKFTALCLAQHGEVYERKGTTTPVCLRGVELEFPEFEEEDR